MDKVLIIDGSFIVHINYNMSLGKGLLKPTDNILEHIKIVNNNSLQSIGALIKRYLPNQVFIAFDLGNSTDLRKAIYEGYKSRDDQDAKYQTINECKRFLYDSLINCGITTLGVSGIEADDLGYFLVQHYFKPEDVESGTLYTGDHDWMQSLKPNWIWKDNKGKSLTYNQFIAKHKSKNHFLAYKCLMGDKSDGITGIHGFGEVWSTRLSEVFLNPSGDFNLVSEIPKFISGERTLTDTSGRYSSKVLLKHLNLISDNLDKIKRNWNLMSIESILNQNWMGEPVHYLLLSHIISRINKTNSMTYIDWVTLASGTSNENLGRCHKTLEHFNRRN